MTAVLDRHDEALAEALDELEADWELWLLAMFPSYTRSDFAGHHRRFWEWLWSIEPGVRSESFFGIWPRGGAKSTSAEIGCVALGARRARSYGLYVCETQDQADDHVGNIGSLLEADSVDEWYPWMGERLVGKYGNSKGWRRNRLRTSTGFTIDAIGLDSAARGVKLEDQRPDFLVFDDIDGTHDTLAATGRKINTITKQILPAGSDDVVVLGIQNVVHPNSVFARIADGRAEFLSRRIVSGPIPAVLGLAVERCRDEGKPRDVIVAGEAVWAGQSLEVCQAQIDDWGLKAFRSEAQHDVAAPEGALWLAAQIDAGRVDRPAWREVRHHDPRLDRVESDLVARTVGVDPSGGDGPDNDEQGIIVVGKASDGHGYVIGDYTTKLSPLGWGRRSVEAAIDFRANIAVERNYGGDMARSTICSAARAMGLRVVESDAEARVYLGDGFVIYVRDVNATQGKVVRAEPVASLYGEKERPETWQDARLHHVGVFPELEAEQTTWEPGKKSPNRIDALVWAALDLGVASDGRSRRLSFRGAA